MSIYLELPLPLLAIPKKKRARERVKVGEKGDRCVCKTIAI